MAESDSGLLGTTRVEAVWDFSKLDTGAEELRSRLSQIEKSSTVAVAAGGGGASGASGSSGGARPNGSGFANYPGATQGNFQFASPWQYNGQLLNGSVFQPSPNAVAAPLAAPWAPPVGSIPQPNATTPAWAYSALQNQAGITGQSSNLPGAAISQNSGFDQWRASNPFADLQAVEKYDGPENEPFRRRSAETRWMRSNRGVGSDESSHWTGGSSEGEIALGRTKGAQIPSDMAYVPLSHGQKRAQLERAKQAGAQFAEEAAKAEEEGAKQGSSKSKTQGGENTGTGRGYGTSRNPFSARGIAPYVGGYVAAYGIEEALKLIGSFGEASDIAAHPERQLEKYERDLSGDSFMQQAASKSANQQASIARAKAIESVPVLGWLVGAADKLSGGTSENEDRQRFLEKSMERHERAVETSRTTGIEAEGKFGDPVKALAMRLSEPIRLLDNQIKQDTQYGISDPAKQRARDDLQRLGQAEINQASAQRQGEFAVTRAGGQAAVLNAQAQEASANQNSGLSLQDRYVASKTQLEAQKQTIQAIGDPEKRAAAMEAWQGQEKALDISHRADVAVNERQQRQAARSAEASGVAAEASSRHDSAAARRATFEAETSTQLENTDIANRDKVSRSIDVRRTAMNVGIAEEETRTDDTLVGRTRRAGLRENRQSFQASQDAFVEGQRQYISQLPEYQRGAAVTAAGAELRERTVDHNRQVAQTLEDFNVRREAAIARAGDKPLEARIIEDTARANREIANAEPGKQRQAAIATNLAELKAERHELFEWHSGGNAAEATVYNLPGDAMDLSGSWKDRKAGMGRIDKEIGYLTKQGASAAAATARGEGRGNDAWTPDMVQKQLALLAQIASSGFPAYTTN